MRERRYRLYRYVFAHSFFFFFFDAGKCLMHTPSLGKEGVMSDSHRLKPCGDPSSAVIRASTGVASAFYQYLPPLESSVYPQTRVGEEGGLPAGVNTFSSDAGSPRIAALTSQGRSAMGHE